MSSAEHWPIGTELWHYTIAAERYEPVLLGRVVRMGRLGVIVRLAEPNQYGGGNELKVMFDCPRIWTSGEAAREWCTEHVGPWHHLERRE